MFCLEVLPLAKFSQNITSYKFGESIEVILSQTGHWEGGLSVKRQDH